MTKNENIEGTTIYIPTSHGVAQRREVTTHDGWKITQVRQAGGTWWNLETTRVQGR